MKHLSELAIELKHYREQLALSQKDMLLNIGMSQQQYQRIESGSDTRLSTLLRVLEGLNLEMMLVPKQHISAVKALINQATLEPEIDRHLPNNLTTETGTSWDKVLHSVDDKEDNL